MKGYNLINLVVSRRAGEARAEVELETPDGSIDRRVAISHSGMVDATYQAINCFFERPFELISFRLRSEGPGSDAKGTVRVVVSKDGKTATAFAESTDIVQAGADAFLSAINDLLGFKEKEPVTVGRDWNV